MVNIKAVATKVATEVKTQAVPVNTLVYFKSHTPTTEIKVLSGWIKFPDGLLKLDSANKEDLVKIEQLRDAISNGCYYVRELTSGEAEIEIDAIKNAGPNKDLLPLDVTVPYTF